MAKTEKLYYENPEQLSCTAVVLDCAEKDGNYYKIGRITVGENK